MVDPGTVISLGGITFRVTKAVRDRILDSELQKFFRELAEAVRDDPKVSTDVKRELARDDGVHGGEP